MNTFNGILGGGAVSIYFRFFSAVVIVLLIFFAYGWTVFEPLSGDALMHVMDSSQVKNFQDLFATLFGLASHGDGAAFRLDIFHRPVFNDWYMSLLKYLFVISPGWYRFSTLIVQSASGVIILSLFWRLSVPVIPSFLGAVALVFAPPLFFGFYEFGISFSQLLVFFAVITLFFSSYYVASSMPIGRLIYGVLTVLFAFLTVFTKESAVLWPAVVIGFIFCIQNSCNGKDKRGSEPLVSYHLAWKGVVKKNIYIFSCLALVSIIYFITRLNKLGSLTAVAGGIEGPVNILESVYKLFGYILYGMGIPTSVNEPYLSVPINAIHGFEFWLRMGLSFLFLLFMYQTYKRSKKLFLFAFFAIICAFLPIVKVTRNSPYYGDLMSIGFAFFVAIGSSTLLLKKWKLLPLVIAIMFTFFSVGQSLYMSKRYIFNSDMWLAQSQGISRAAFSDAESIGMFSKASHLVQVGRVGDLDVIWALNQNLRILGSGFFANLGYPVSKFSIAKSPTNFFSNTMYFEFQKDDGFRKVGMYFLPGFGRLNSAYFPGEIAITRIEARNGFYPLEASKVIRIQCSRPLDANAPLNFSIGFVLNGNEKVIRHIDNFFNISVDSTHFVAEFVVPLNSINMFFENAGSHDCINPIIEGYS